MAVTTSTSFHSGQRLRGLGATFVVLGTAAATLLAVTATALCCATAAPPELRFFDPRRPPTIDEAWAVSVMDYALSSDEKNDVVFLGDSACRSAAEPVQFERLTRLHAYNLGVLFGGLGPDVLQQVVRSYLLRHPRPQLLVLCPSPVCFERDVPKSYLRIRDRFLSCYRFENPDLRSLEGILNYITSTSYMLQQGTLLAWHDVSSSLTRQHHDVRDDPLTGETTQTYRSREQLTRRSRGFYRLSGSGHITSLDRPGGVVGVRSDWDRGIRQLAESCQDAHVPLMIRLAPISAEASKNLNFSSVESWLADLKSTYPHLIVSGDHDPLRYRTEQCFDSIHLNLDGAGKFTAQLAQEVRAALDFQHGHSP
jgi:hypothetical protein